MARAYFLLTTITYLLFHNLNSKKICIKYSFSKLCSIICEKQKHGGFSLQIIIFPNSHYLIFFLNFMKRQEKKETMGKVYREFSRQKYNKYKHQFPKMRESQIVSKIIKEWQALIPEAKEKLHKQYLQNKFLTAEDISESENSKKKEQARKSARHSSQKFESVVSSVQPISQRSGDKQKEDSDYQRASDNQNDSKVVDSDSVGLIINPRSDKTKQIRKQSKGTAGQTQYMIFFKTFYEKCRRQHPKWTPNQITVITKLLWKKRKQSTKRINHATMNRNRRILTGRKYFRKQKGYDGNTAYYYWRRLPFQTKELWEHKAKNIQQKADNKKKANLNLKAKSENTQPAPFKFIRKTMK